jgi:hypothetical protein
MLAEFTEFYSPFEENELEVPTFIRRSPGEPHSARPAVPPRDGVPRKSFEHPSGRYRMRPHRPPAVPHFDAERMPRTELRGRIVLQREHELVVEFELDAAIDWSAPRQAIVHLPGGETRQVRVDRKRTTRSGRLVERQIVRLVLRLDSPLPTSPGESTVTNRSMLLAIELRISGG